jgi:hypothetical protein
MKMKTDAELETEFQVLRECFLRLRADDRTDPQRYRLFHRLAGFLADECFIEPLRLAAKLRGRQLTPDEAAQVMPLCAIVQACEQEATEEDRILVDELFTRFNSTLASKSPGAYSKHVTHAAALFTQAAVKFHLQANDAAARKANQGND